MRKLTEQEIDHINGIRTDNRIINLRSVSSSENSKNMRLSERSISGVMGVTWCKQTNKWQSHIRIKGKHIRLGRYLTLFDAVSARKSAEVGNGYHINHGRIE